MSIGDGIVWINVPKRRLAPLISLLGLGGAISSATSGERILSETGSVWRDLTEDFLRDPLVLLSGPVLPFYGKYVGKFLITYYDQAKLYDGSSFIDLTTMLGFRDVGEIVCVANGPEFWLVCGHYWLPNVPRLVKLYNDLSRVEDVSSYYPYSAGPVVCEYAPELGVFLLRAGNKLCKTSDGINYVEVLWGAAEPIVNTPYSIEWNGSYFLIAGGTALGGVSLWKYDGSTCEEVTGHPFTGADESILAIRWNGRYFLLGSSFGRLVKYDGSSFTTLKTYSLGGPYGIAWLPKIGNWYIGGGTSDGEFPFMESYDGAGFENILPESGFTRTISGLDSVELSPPAGKKYLIVNATTGGTTNPAPEVYLYDTGSIVTVTAVPNEGYEFTYWTVNGEVSYENPLTVTLDMNTTITAHFQALTYLFFENWSSINPSYWESSVTHVLDTADYVSEPSSLTNLPDWEIAQLCQHENTINLPEGRIDTFLKIDTIESEYRSTASFFLKCNDPVGDGTFTYGLQFIPETPPPGEPGDFMTHCYDGYTVVIRPISNKVSLVYSDAAGVVTIKDTVEITSPPSNWLSWNKYKVRWWNEGSALKVRVERWTGSQWVRMCNDMTDPSRVDTERQRCGIGGYVSIDNGIVKFDDTGILG